MRLSIIPLLLATCRAGTLSFLPDEPQLTFAYSTPGPNDENWVGVYRASHGGPVEEKFVEESLAWNYAAKGNGTVRVEAGTLTPGEYTAFLLARDGYEWLAEPVNVSVAFAEGPVRFLLEQVVVRNVRVGERFEEKVGGFRAGGGKGEGVFSKVEGDEWVDVSREGVVSGTPGVVGNGEVVVEVAVGEASARMQVVIPVKPAEGLLVDELRVMSWNLWHGGTQVKGFHEKQLRFLAASGADIVGMQETTGGHATRLGEALGWYSWQGPMSVGAVSRYPIVDAGTAAGERAGWVRVDVGGREVVVWIVHLGYDPYGPYDFCFNNMTVEEVMVREGESGRTGQIKEVVSAMGEDLKGEKPVFLVGDFNAPSHLDWVDGLEEEHCGQGLVRWATSVEPTEVGGMVDSFRTVHPDPKARPGVTWSPVFVENEGRREPMDRIDFVYFRSGQGVEVLGSEELVVGEPKPIPGHGENEWTSDHKAVLTVFSLGKGLGDCRRSPSGG
ncbi:endonuclease/exonuclease/phosphatase family [Colletotrichum sojae]|uniref:Endonuclease/exonuclease/phosphatase family n=1 Tax=Colletotrichum sojae TaxID=2175907 RepID=A0A8H6J5C6_9PEZI|nr:endonuclease/exonuclease/phosphatase family [Colletotrichum sojae]